MTLCASPFRRGRKIGLIGALLDRVAARVTAGSVRSHAPMSTLVDRLGFRRTRRALLALLLALDLLAANATLLTAPRPAAAQQSEADVFVAQAILAYDARRYDEALSLLQEALAQDPNNVEALYYSGLVLMAQQKTEQAVEVLEKARARSPRDLSIQFLLGVAYFALERYDQAEGPLTQVLNERPQTEGVGYYVGLIRYRKKDYQGALKAFKTETSKNPNIQQLVRFYSGLTLAILGLPEQAVAEVDAALKLQTGSALTGPAERIRDTLSTARDAERRFHAEVRVGFLYDSNVAVLPQPSHDPTAESLRHKNTATPGELAALRTLGVDGHLFVLPDVQQPSAVLQRAEPSGGRRAVVSRRHRLDAVPGGRAVLLGLPLARGPRLPAAPHRDPVRDAGREQGQPDHPPGPVPGQGFLRHAGATPRRGPRRQELDDRRNPRLPLRGGPALHPGRLPVRLRGRGRAELYLLGQSIPGRGAVHAAVGVDAAQVRLRPAPAPLPARQHAAARSESGHPGARGPRAEPRVPDRAGAGQEPGAHLDRLRPDRAV